MNSHPPSLYTGFNFETGGRVLFFIVVAAIALVFLSFGVGSTAILTTAACAAMGYEWFSVTTEGRAFDEPILPIAIAAAALPPFLAFAGGPTGAIVVALLAAGFLLFMGPKDEKALIRTAAGIFVIGFAGVCFVWLRSDPQHGLGLTAWLVIVVAATEAGGEIADRFFIKSDDAASSDSNALPTRIAVSVVSGAVGGLVAGAFYREGSLFLVIIVSALVALVVLLAGMITKYVKQSLNSDAPGALFLGKGAVIENFDGLVCASIFAGFLMLSGGALFNW